MIATDAGTTRLGRGGGPVIPVGGCARISHDGSPCPPARATSSPPGSDTPASRARPAERPQGGVSDPWGSLGRRSARVGSHRQFHLVAGQIILDGPEWRVIERNVVAESFLFRIRLVTLPMLPLVAVRPSTSMSSKQLDLVVFRERRSAPACLSPRPPQLTVLLLPRVQVPRRPRTGASPVEGSSARQRHSRYRR